MYVLLKNDKTRVIAEYIKKWGEGCEWRVHMLLSKVNGLFTIRKLNNVHTRVFVSRVGKDSMMNSKLIARLIEDWIRRDPLVSPVEVITHFKEVYGFDIQYYLVWKSKDIASTSIRGDVSVSYNHLRLYIDCLMELNPSSRCVLEVCPETKCFQRLFVAFRPSINGFRYCRPVLFLDGTFLKGKYKGHLLAANEKSANNGNIYICDIHFS